LNYLSSNSTKNHFNTIILLYLISNASVVSFLNTIDHQTQWFNPYPTAFPYGNGMVLHFYQQQESSTTKTVHKVVNKGLKAYV